MSDSNPVLKSTTITPQSEADGLASRSVKESNNVNNEGEAPNSSLEDSDRGNNFACHFRVKFSNRAPNPGQEPTDGSVLASLTAADYGFTSESLAAMGLEGLKIEEKTLAPESGSFVFNSERRFGDFNAVLEPQTESTFQFSSSQGFGNEPEQQPEESNGSVQETNSFPAITAKTGKTVPQANQKQQKKNP